MFLYRLVVFRRVLRVGEKSKRYPAISRLSNARTLTVTAVAKSKSMKVAVLGAAGQTGKCTSLFLKQCYLIDELSIYDKIDVTSLGLELNHIDTRCRVTTSTNDAKGLEKTLHDAKIVMIMAGQSFHKARSENEILVANSKIIMNYIPNVLKYCPGALVGLATSPVNHLVPLAVEVYKKFGIFDSSRIFGITTLNCVRANTFAAEVMRLEPECVMVPVIGGNCSKTCVPVFSQTRPCSQLTHEEISKITHAVRMAEDEVAQQYSETGKSSLAMGFASARFCVSLCKAVQDQRGVVECAYARSCVIPEVTYFAGPLELGPTGIQKHLGVPPLTNQECKLLASAIPHLQAAIKSGEALALGPRAVSTEMCPPDSDPCNKEISGKIRKSNNIPQPCPI